MDLTAWLPVQFPPRYERKEPPQDMHSASKHLAKLFERLPGFQIVHHKLDENESQAGDIVSVNGYDYYVR